MYLGYGQVVLSIGAQPGHRWVLSQQLKLTLV